MPLASANPTSVKEAPMNILICRGDHKKCKCSQWAELVLQIVALVLSPEVSNVYPNRTSFVGERRGCRKVIEQTAARGSHEDRQEGREKYSLAQLEQRYRRTKPQNPAEQNTRLSLICPHLHDPRT